MCLAIPGKILKITETGDTLFRQGQVTFGGVVKEVNLAMVPEARQGDYVLVHVGVAIDIVDEEEAQKTFDYLKKMGELEELGSIDEIKKIAENEISNRIPGPGKS